MSNILLDRVLTSGQIPLRACLFARLDRLAPFVYLCVALPIVVFHSFALPPFQAADEENHFLRVVQLSRGEIIGTRISDISAGGKVDAGAPDAAHRFDYLKFRPDLKLEPERLRSAREIRWTPHDLSTASFGNTVIYPPVLYLPAVLGVKAAQWLNRPVVDGLYFARLATGLFATALAVGALSIAGPGTALLFAVLCLPMTLSLFASCTQDGMAIAISALAVALCSRAIARGEYLDPSARVAVAMLLGAVVAARPPYAPVLLLLCLSIMRPSRERGGLRSVLRNSAPLLAIALGMALGWSFVGAAPAKVPFRPDQGVSISGQLSFLLAHPAAVLPIAANTLTRYAGHYFDQFVGVLGWLDTRLPSISYPLFGVGLVVAGILDLSSGKPGLRPLDRVLVLGSILLAVLFIFGAQYLSWTAVGADFVDGVQGRYFIVAALLLALAVPARFAPLGRAAAPWRMGVAAFGWIGLFAIALTVLWLVPWAILLRYYG